MAQIITTKEQKAVRLAICSQCEWKIVSYGMDVCGKCKCPLGGKTTLAQAKCPASKWPVI